MKTWRFTKFFRLPPVNILTAISAIGLTGTSCFLIWAKTSQFPLAIPLWFSQDWGERWLAAPVFLWLLPLISFLTLLANFSLAHLFWARERLLSHILIGTSLITSVLLLYSLLNIVLVVT
jgi:hypothetical protein